VIERCFGLSSKYRYSYALGPIHAADRNCCNSAILHGSTSFDRGTPPIHPRTSDLSPAIFERPAAFKAIFLHPLAVEVHRVEADSHEFAPAEAPTVHLLFVGAAGDTFPVPAPDHLRDCNVGLTDLLPVFGCGAARVGAEHPHEWYIG
jgi:hypothetical protein